MGRWIERANQLWSVTKPENPHISFDENNKAWLMHVGISFQSYTYGLSRACFFLGLRVHVKLAM